MALVSGWNFTSGEIFVGSNPTLMFVAVGVWVPIMVADELAAAY